MSTQSQKKYKVIAKVSNKVFKKWHVNDLIAFTRFLDNDYPGWRFFNVFRYTKDDSGEKLTSFTCKNRPTSKLLAF